MKYLKAILQFIAVFACLILYLFVSGRVGLHKSQSRYTITIGSDATKEAGLDKYVSEAEMQSFAFRYWDIDYNSNPKNVFKEPAIDVELKKTFKKQAN